MNREQIALIRIDRHLKSAIRKSVEKNTLVAETFAAVDYGAACAAEPTRKNRIGWLRDCSTKSGVLPHELSVFLAKLFEVGPHNYGHYSGFFPIPMPQTSRMALPRAR